MELTWVRGRLRMSFLVLSLLALSVGSARAFEVDEAVYAHLGEEQAWAPGTYVALRNDCVVLEHVKTKFRKLDLASSLADGRSKALKNYRVVETGQRCHAVKVGSVRYTKSDGAMSSAAFKKLIGARRDFASGDWVYTTEDYDHLAKDSERAERWQRRKITGRRQDCYETDLGPILSGLDLGLLYASPAVPASFAVGSKVLVKASYVDRVWTAMTIDGADRDGLTVSVGSPNEDIFFRQKVKKAETRTVPAALTEADFARLAPATTVLHYEEPAACTTPFYRPLAIVGPKRPCYVIDHDGEPASRIGERLIAADALPSS